MLSIVNYKYGNDCLGEIENWSFGINWPTVYIAYNEDSAYIGETLNAARRTRQHLTEESFSDFSDICLISSKTFNKSVVLDLESYLIKYISAEGCKTLTNANLGVVDHDYFYKEAYEDDFKEIWKRLQEFGIVQKSIVDIENSELFKYSPYKTLNVEQQKTAYEIIQNLCNINNATRETLIKITGCAGTGKTILAVYLVKLLKDMADNKPIWITVEDSEDAVFIEKLSEKLAGVKKIGFVVPMVQLRTTMKRIFRSVDGLSEDMVLAPEEVVNDYYDVLIVDEAHRLYQRKHLPGSHLYIKFDSINRKLMGDSFKGDETDYTELDWIIKSSRMQIIFYDEFQTIRATDIGPDRFNAITKPILSYWENLSMQMRCKGGDQYYSYIKAVIEGKGKDSLRYKNFFGYELRVFDSIEALETAVNDKENSDRLCRMITGPGWSIGEPIIIEGKKYCWGSDVTNPKSGEIFSIHKIQGFDLNYAGVIFGKEVTYDEIAESIIVNKSELKDNFIKSNGDAFMKRYVYNIYITLMTRGIDGTLVYAVDEKLREYLKQYFS